MITLNSTFLSNNKGKKVNILSTSLGKYHAFISLHKPSYHSAASSGHNIDYHMTISNTASWTIYAALYGILISM